MGVSILYIADDERNFRINSGNIGQLGEDKKIGGGGCPLPPLLSFYVEYYRSLLQRGVGWK